MRNSTWSKIRDVFPYNLLVFKPRREFTIGEIIAIAEKAGYHLNLRLVKNGEQLPPARS